MWSIYLYVHMLSKVFLTTSVDIDFLIILKRIYSNYVQTFPNRVSIAQVDQMRKYRKHCRSESTHFERQYSHASVFNVICLINSRFHLPCKQRWLGWHRAKAVPSLGPLLATVFPSHLHIESETKWTPFRRRHFQMHFLEWKCIISLKISLEFVP